MRHGSRLYVAVAVIAVAAATAWFTRGERDSRPEFVRTPDQNVLLITIDTLRADALGMDGGRASTPNLDRLATGGVRFAFAHAHAVMTLPSHASILTGRYPHEHGVRDNAGFRLGTGAETLAELARQHGMATAAFVGAFPLDRQFGLDQGFDLYEDVGTRQSPGGELSLTERRAAAVAASASEWIRKQPGRWFAWVHVFDPHAPYAPPAPFDTDYESDKYAGEVAYTDHALAPLLDAVGVSPRPTTVVVTSDHGEGMGEHGETTHGTFAYESTLKVPLIIAQLRPGSTPARGSGALRTDPVSHADIFPTIAAALKLEPPAGLPGRSLLDEAGEERRFSYFEAMSPMLTRGWAPLRGVLIGREKYIELPIEELYDLAADPQERQNLAGGAGRVDPFVAQLRRHGAALPTGQSEETAEVRARLQALGYASGAAARRERYTAADDPKRLIELDRLMLHGLDLHRQRRSGEAIAVYRDVVQKRPDMMVAYRRLAFVQWESGNPAGAIATLREALARNGADIDTEIRLGTYLAETGRAAEAVPLLERVAAASANREGMNALGIAYAQAGRTGDALRMFERILAKDPRDVFALENAATVHLRRNDLAAAREAFTRALAQDSRSSRAHAGLGVIARQQGRVDEAIQHWQRAVEMDRSNFDALYNLANELLRAGRTVEARPYVVQFVQSAPATFYAADVERFRRWLAGSTR